MAVKHLLKSSGWVAMAAAMTVASLPISAAAQERGWGRRAGEAVGNIGGTAAESGGRSWGGGNGGWGQRQQSAPQVQVQTQVQAPAAIPAPQQHSWGGGSRRSGGDSAVNAGWRGNWAPRNQQPSAAQAQAQVPAQPQRSWSGSEGWQNRQGNGTNERWQGRRGGWNGSQTATPAPAPRSAEQWNGGNPRRDGSSTWSESNRNGSSDWRNRTYRDGNRERRNENWSGDRRRDNWSDNNRWQANNSWRDNNRRGYSDSRRWNREWRNNNRYDWYSYRNHNHDLFRWGYYHPPYRSYSYRRLSIGFYLDSLFFGSNYWINDPWQYRLPDAYGPYRWIRYYDDALLVDIYSGEVVDVIYNFFW